MEVVYKESGSFIKSYIMNVNGGGLFIKTATPLPLDSKVTLSLTLPGDTEVMTLEGVVVWTNPRGGKNSFPKGMGVKFLNIKSEHGEKINKLVKEHKKEIENFSLI
jgi:uncharacterized protein (TIGR02266 family)